MRDDTTLFILGIIISDIHQPNQYNGMSQEFWSLFICWHFGEFVSSWLHRWFFSNIRHFGPGLQKFNFDKWIVIHPTSKESQKSRLYRSKCIAAISQFYSLYIMLKKRSWSGGLSGRQSDKRDAHDEIPTGWTRTSGASGGCTVCTPPNSEKWDEDKQLVR